MSEQSSAEKTEEATPRRRQEARRKGTVAKSSDLASALTVLAAALVLPPVTSRLAESALIAFRENLSRVPTNVSPGTLVGFTSAVAGPAILAAAPLILTMMAVGLAANFAQVGFVISAESLNPTWDKVNPINGFKRLFSMRSTFEGLKAVFKLFLFGYIAYATVASDWARIVGLGTISTAHAGQVVGQVAHTILWRIAVVWLALAAIDYFFQRKQVDKQLRMTKDELRREMKEQEGSPEIKAAQYQRRRKLLKGGLAARMKNADVVITNPTHFAIAIQYDRSKMHAPMVVAKGQDYLALKMREIASQMRVPTVENRPLARSLYKKCEVGDFVPREMFGAVAEVLAYVYRTVKNTRAA